MQLCLAGGVLVLWCAGLWLPGTIAVSYRYAGCYHNSICYPSACWSGGNAQTYLGYHKKPPLFLKDAGLDYSACQSKAVAARKPFFALHKHGLAADHGAC